MKPYTDKTIRVSSREYQPPQDWMNEQGWVHREDWIFTGCYSSSANDYEWNFNFHDANKAMLFKLTWGC